MRLFWIFIGFAALVIIPFLFWREDIEAMFSQEGAIEWLRDFGAWAWIAGIGLLISDLALPIPGTIVMSALGYVYGPFLGGMIASTGSFLSGLVGYGLCRSLGRHAATWMIGERDLARGHDLFARYGGWLVAWSRWLPVFPEVISCMAGLIRMPFGTFVAALACGCLPMGFAFAAIGHTGVENPAIAIALSALMPLLLWLLTQRFIRPRSAKMSDSASQKPLN